MKVEPIEEDMNIKSIRGLSVKFKTNFEHAKDEVVPENTTRPVLIEEDADEQTTEKN